MSDEIEQEHYKKKLKKGQGGYISVLHSLEQTLYGPDSPADAKTKILLYLRHRALRDWTQKKQIPKSEFIEATGLKPTALKDALRSLEKNKWILVTRVKVGKIWSDNIYELHPERFGNDYIYRPENPSFRVIYGSKGHKSNPPRKLSTADRELFTNINLGPKSALGVGPKSALGVGPKSALDSDTKNSESLNNSPSKNPLKEPFKRTLCENEFFEETEAEKKAREDAINHIKMICGGVLKQIP